MKTNQKQSQDKKAILILWMARLAYFWEHFLPAFLPLGLILGLFISLALFDILPLLPNWLHLLVLLFFGVGIFWALAKSRSAVKLPSVREAKRRVETKSGLSHRPLTSLDDKLISTTNKDSGRLWELHRIRLIGSLKNLRAGKPEPNLARHDPLALRAGIILALFVGFFWSNDDPTVRLKNAFLLAPPETTSTSKTVLDIWISPPEYTGLPPIFPLQNKSMDLTLPSQTGNQQKIQNKVFGQSSEAPVLEIPFGSQVTAQAQSSNRPPYLVIEETNKNSDDLGGVFRQKQFLKIDEKNSQIVQEIRHDGSLSVESEGNTLAKWRVSVVPDNPPRINFVDKPKPNPQASSLVSFSATDDYGLKRGWIEIKRTYEKGTVVGKETLKIKLTFPADYQQTVKENMQLDLASHKWAGAPVLLKLYANDTSGQVGHSSPFKYQLPERRFNHPVARDIASVRRELFKDLPNRDAVVQRLRAILSVPDLFANDVVVYLGLSSASARIVYEKKDTAIQPVTDLLWDIALRLEDGRLSIAEREMRRLQNALNKALLEGADQKKLDELMRQLKIAIQRYMQALAEQMRRKPQDIKEIEFDPNTMRMMSQSDIQRMMKQMQDMMQSGNREGARQMLARLQQMLSNMRSMQVIRARSGRMGRRAGAMRQLQQLIRKQQSLMDRTFQFGRPSTPPLGQMPGPADQRALRQMLQKLQSLMRGGQGLNPGEFLDKAGKSMDQAIRALRGNRPTDAVGAQSQALQSLQQAGQQMMRQLREQFSRESGNGQVQKDRNRPSLDPLGREVEEGDGFDQNTIKINSPSTLKRARQILDELRQRAGEQFRPRMELDYIDRLLERF